MSDLPEGRLVKFTLTGRVIEGHGDDGRDKDYVWIMVAGVGPWQVPRKVVEPL